MSGIHVGRKAAQLAVIDATIIVVALFLSAIVARIGAGFAVVPLPRGPGREVRAAWPLPRGHCFQ